MMNTIYAVLAMVIMANASEVMGIEVQGHRGARARYPENTLPAFEYALNLGVDVLELDLGVTKDDVVVVAHDSTLNPDICLDPNGKKLSDEVVIRKLKLSELKKYDCGTLKNPRFPNQTPVPGTKIPTLDEVFDAIAHNKSTYAQKVHFNIETKLDPTKPDLTVGYKKFVKLVLDVVNKHGLLSRVIIQSFDYRTLVEAKKLEPKVRTAALTDKADEDFVKTVTELKADILSPDARILTKDKITQLHSIGAKVIPWTVNDPRAWQMLIDAGVDGIITDDPEELLKYLKR